MRERERTFENLVFVTVAEGLTPDIACFEDACHFPDFARSAKSLQDISTAMLRMTWAKAGETGGVAA